MAVSAEVIPIFKRGSKELPSNYRPVSLTCVVSKVLERLIEKSIGSHLNKHSLILPKQHGIKGNKSCATNLLTVLEHLTRAIDMCQATHMTYFMTSLKPLIKSQRKGCCFNSKH